MPGPRKGPSSRRPPEPSGSHARIAECLEGTMPGLQPIVTHLDRLVRKRIPGLEYAVKWKKAYYGLPGRGWIIEMAAYDVSVNLVFFAGAQFDQPPPHGEGSRYVKVRSLEEAKAPEIREWIDQAARHDGWS